MSKYYYLIASLPELTLDDNKLSYTIAGFKEELYSNLSGADKKLIDLFYLKFDNANIVRLLQDKEAEIDARGNYTVQQLLAIITAVKEGDKITSKECPPYLVKFVADYFKEEGSETEDTTILQEDRIAALYYEYGMQCGNTFVASWFEYNSTINNILIALTGRKYKISVASYILGDTEVTDLLRTSGARDFGLASEIEYYDQLVKISEVDELLERERKLDVLRWDWMENAIFFSYFDIERVFAFLVKLEMIERWISLDREKGNKLFREIIDSLKDEVQIPAEFR